MTVYPELVDGFFRIECEPVVTGHYLHVGSEYLTKQSWEIREMLKILLLLTSLFLSWPRIGVAQTHFVHSHSGTSSSQLAIWAAKDLNLFAKYRLDVDLVFISGGARGMQALIGGSTQAADSDGVAPIHAILRGGDAVIVAGLNNKTLFKFPKKR